MTDKTISMEQEYKSPLDRVLCITPYGRIKQVRADIMDICGVGPSTISNWQNGKSEPKTALKIKINKYFGETIYPVNL